MRTPYLACLVALMLVFHVSAQQLIAPLSTSTTATTTVPFQATPDVWSNVKESNIPKVGTQYITPSVYRTVQLDISELLPILDVAPLEFSAGASSKTVLLDLPLPDGSMETFQILNSPIMEPGLAALYPDIRTFSGFSVNTPGMNVRFDLTPQGFHGMIMIAGKSTVYIDPYSFGGGDTENYIVYERLHFGSSVAKSADCALTTPTTTTTQPQDPTALSFSSCELRTYRLALAATGEYTTFHGGTVAGAAAAQVTTMNRVNGVYERDAAIRMIIVAGNNALIFTNSASDPYTNNNGATMLGQNQTEVDNTIGNANYDIGHVFSTGGGGIAGLGVVCATGNKARGVTGSPAPVGDPFDIDYVCHEMGHQFSANHTQNNNCQRNNATAMEPGSASTIMGYAGICPPNVQNNSDDHFHGVSLAEIGAFISAFGGSCPVTTPLTNNAPTISGTNASGITIPAGTPFALTATATDPDGDILTYNWEQMDNQISTQPPVSTATGGPNFRSYSSSTDPTRYFPNLTDLSNGGPFTWEVLPTVSRTMNFRCVVRDNATGGGCHDHTDVTFNIDAGSGPFVVQYPSNTGISWSAFSNETVTWDVANTDQAPVSCATVDILLSTDGGLTYPTVLASNVPNDGSETITVPNTPTTTARVMVICSSGTFFDISDNNFEITAATFDYTLTTSNNSVSVCSPLDAVYTIDIGQIGGYTGPVNLSVSGLPAGATFAFSTNPVTPAGTSTLTISNTGAVTPGSYTFNVDATSTSGPQTLALDLSINNGSPAAIALTSPANSATGVSTNTTFAWAASPEFGATYEIEIATDAGFTTIVDQATGLATNSYVSAALSSSTIYFWRVRVVTGCGTSPWSSAFTFETSTCTTYASTNVPVTIPTTAGTITSTLNVPTAGVINDVNVASIIGTHTWINDLTVTLTSPTGTVVTLWDQVCNNEDDFDLAFDDAATPGALPCPPVGGGTYQPNTVLSAFNGEASNGTWTLTITDNANQDGGTLTGWSLEVCVSPPSGDDAGISAIVSPTAQVCENPFVPEVTITNYGTSNLTSATINYQVDGGPVQTQNWTGNLTAGSSENVVLAPITSATVGTPVIFTAYTTLPNGSVDPLNTNDTTEVTTTVLQSGVFPYAEDFEGGALPAEYQLINTDANAIVWDYSNTVSGFGTGTGSAFIDNFNTNAPGTLDWMILPPLDLSSSTGTEMTFDVAYAGFSATLNDTLIVAVNDDCGTNYTPEYYVGGDNLSTITGYSTTAFTPTAAQWRTETIDLSAYDGMTDVRVAFINLSGYGNLLYVDNINIQSTSSAVNGTDTQVACDTYTWIDGNTYTASNNTATFLIQGGAVGGLDSLVTLDLTINNSSTSTDVQSACGSYTWIDGNTYTASNNTATFTLANAVGCDSVVTLDLTINQPTSATDAQTACGSYTWIDGNTYTASNNTATFTLTNAAGCDSTVTLDLTINQATSSVDVQTACGSFTWIDGNTYTASNNTATFLTTNAAGCDSTVTLNLTINQPTSATDVQTACGPFAWIDGNTYTASNNTATFTTTNTAGCDSVITLDLTVNAPTSGTDVQIACGSYTWIDGNTYTANNNTATFTVTNAAGCDSLVTLDLTISNTIPGTDVQAACGPFTWIDGNTYTASNNTATYTLVGGSINGCDSLVTLNLTVGAPNTGTDVQNACGPFTWIDGNTYTSNNNTATFTVTNASGCDSVVTLDLTITTVDNGINQVSYNVLEANSTTGTYQWIDCSSNIAIGGATNQQYTAPVNGQYAVIVTEGPCSDTSACITVNTIGIDELEENIYQLYPNPTDGQLTVELTQHDFNTYVLYDATGRVVKRGNIHMGTNIISIVELARGTYTFEIEGHSRVKSVVKL